MPCGSVSTHCAAFLLSNPSPCRQGIENLFYLKNLDTKRLTRENNSKIVLQGTCEKIYATSSFVFIFTLALALNRSIANWPTRLSNIVSLQDLLYAIDPHEVMLRIVGHVSYLLAEQLYLMLCNLAAVSQAYRVPDNSRCTRTVACFRNSRAWSKKWCNFCPHSLQLKTAGSEEITQISVALMSCPTSNCEAIKIFF